MPDVLPTGETALWRAVVLQAFQDATLGLHEASPRRKPPRLSAERRVHAGAARAWLLRNSADFRQVCNLAGLEPEAVRRAAQVAIDRCKEQLSATEQKQAQPISRKRPSGERVLARRPVSEGDVGRANRLKNGSFPGHNQCGKDRPGASPASTALSRFNPSTLKL